MTFIQYSPPPGLKPGRYPADNTATVCDCRPEYITCNHDILCPGGKILIEQNNWYLKMIKK